MQYIFGEDGANVFNQIVKKLNAAQLSYNSEEVRYLISKHFANLPSLVSLPEALLEAAKDNTIMEDASVASVSVTSTEDAHALFVKTLFEQNVSLATIADANNLVELLASSMLVLLYKLSHNVAGTKRDNIENEVQAKIEAAKKAANVTTFPITKDMVLKALATMFPTLATTAMLTASATTAPILNTYQTIIDAESLKQQKNSATTSFQQQQFTTSTTAKINKPQ